MLSMIFAITSMLPHRYFGKSYRKSGYKGTLYAENFSNQSLSEFKKEFDRIMNTGKAVYDELITDLYFSRKDNCHKTSNLIAVSYHIYAGIINNYNYFFNHYIDVRSKVIIFDKWGLIIGTLILVAM